MATETLMTPKDVIDFTFVRKLKISVCNFDQLFTIEFEQARKCLGLDFWQDMIDAKVDYSTAPEWVQGSMTALDAVVKHKSIFYQAIQDAITSQPPTAGDWKVAPRFSGDCGTAYDDLFCKFLAPFLANKVLARRLPFIKSMITDSGILELKGEVQDIDAKDYSSLINAANRDSALSWGNLLAYMKLKPQTDLKETCFKNWPPFKEEEDACKKEDKTCTTRKHRTGIYDFG